MLPILLGSLVMFYVLLFFLQGDYFGKSKFSEILGLSVMILLGAVSYGFVLILLKFPGDEPLFKESHGPWYERALVTIG